MSIDISSSSISEKTRNVLLLVAEARRHQAEQKARLGLLNKGPGQNSVNNSFECSSTLMNHVQNITQKAQEIEIHFSSHHFQSFARFPDLEYKIGKVSRAGNINKNEFCIRIRSNKKRIVIGNFYVQCAYNIKLHMNRSDTNENSKYYTLNNFVITSIIKEGGSGRNIYANRNGEPIARFSYFSSFLFSGVDIGYDVEQVAKAFFMSEQQKTNFEKE